MDIFDKNYMRSYADHQTPKMSDYEFFNESCWPQIDYYRGVIDTWFMGYPEKLKTKFINDVKNQFVSKLFELFWFDRLSRYRSLKVDPIIEGKTPDFIIEGPSLNTVFEVTCCYKPGRPSRFVEGLVDYINKSKKLSDYLIYFSVLSNNNYDEKNIDLYEKIQNFILSNIKKSETIFDYSDLSIIFYFKNKTNEAFRTCWGYAGPAKFANEINEIKEVLEKKFEKYEYLDIPLVVSLTPHYAWWLPDSDLEQSLFGKRVVSSCHNSYEFEYNYTSYEPNGLWFDENGPKNTHVKYVIFVKRFYPTNLDLMEVVTFKNPWCKFNG